MKVINKTTRETVKTIYFLLFLFTSSLSNAQNFEVGLFGGVTNYQGDLADGAIVFRETEPAYGVLLRYSPLDFLTFKASLTLGTLRGDDKNSSNEDIRQRGYAFKANLRELGFFAELHLPGYASSGQGIFKASFSPFLFAGIGFTSTDGKPTAPAGRLPYPFPEVDAKNSFICVPFGGGFKWHFIEKMSASIEWGARDVFNDYLDGISKNGNPKANDWYMFGGITLTYVLDGGGDNPFGRMKR